LPRCCSLEGDEDRSFEVVPEAMPAYELGPATYALLQFSGGTRCDEVVQGSEHEEDDDLRSILHFISFQGRLCNQSLSTALFSLMPGNTEIVSQKKTTGMFGS
jgi:hypothetical protein